MGEGGGKGAGLARGGGGITLGLWGKLYESLDATQQCRIKVLALDSIFIAGADQLGAECFIECRDEHLLQLRYFILRRIQHRHVIGICKRRE